MRFLLLRSAPVFLVEAAAREVSISNPGAVILPVEAMGSRWREGEEKIVIGAERFEGNLEAIGASKEDTIVVTISGDRAGYRKLIEAAERRASVLVFTPGYGLGPPRGSGGALKGAALAVLARLARPFISGGSDPILREAPGIGMDEVYFLERASILNGLMTAVPEGGGLAVDLGAGTAPYRRLIEGKGYRYLGLDREDRGGAGLIGTAEAVPLRAGTASLVLSVETIEHTRRPELLVMESARILGPGGRLVLVAPQVWGLHEEPDDYYRFTCHGLAALIGGGGLTIERIIRRGAYRAAAIQRLVSHLARRGARRLGRGGPFDYVAALNHLGATRDADPNETLGWIAVAVKE